MEESVEDLKKKLDFNKQQLKKVKHLLSTKKENDTLRTLKRDLEQVIKLTTELVNLKEGKVVATQDGSGERSVAPSVPEDIHGKGKKRKAPREWGEEKERWEVGERCQVKVHSRWELGVVLGRERNVDGKVMWQINLLEKNFPLSAHKSRMRTYVVPLVSELGIGHEVKAFHEGKFKRGMIEDKTQDKKYRISFLKTGHAAIIPLQDIQLSKFKTQKMSKDGKGFWHVAEPVIPQHLQDKSNDTEQQRDTKRKRRKQIRKEHNLLMKQAACQNRRNNWQLFQTKVKKKSKSTIGTSLKSFRQQSMFASPTTLDQKVGVGHGVPRMTEYHEHRHHHALKRTNNYEEDEYSDEDYE